jgi:hypothetical protein
MSQKHPFVGYFATTEAMLYPEHFDFRSLRIVPVEGDGGTFLSAENEAKASFFSVLVNEKTKTETPARCIGDFAKKSEAEAFRIRMVRLLDTSNEIAETALCLWEALLHIRATNNPDDVTDIDTAIEAVYRHHGTSEMRRAMYDLSEACDREYTAAAMEGHFDGSFDWEWCPDWLRTRVHWDPDGKEFPAVLAPA